MRLLSVPSNLNRFEESIPTLFLNCTPSYSEESIPSLFLLFFSFHFSKFASIYFSQIISSDLLNHLKQIHGSSYEEFMKRKLIPIHGDIGEDILVMRLMSL